MGKLPEKAKPKQWKGLKPAQFRPYRNWINNQHPGICGTYVCAVLLHDEFKQRYDVELPQDQLLKGLESVVEDTLPYRGTFPWDLWYGLNFMLRDQTDLKAKMALITERKVVERLDRPNPRPVAVGTTRIFNSKYNNHWLVIYAYGYNQEGKLFFKGYDNHGRYRAVIPASTTFGCVWIEEQDEES